MATTKLIPSKPALILEGEKRHLIITDLHLGFESSLAQNKIFVGKNTTLNEITEEVLSLIRQQGPDDLVILGDVKSSIDRIAKNEWDDVPSFLRSVGEKTEVLIIPGNHDGNIQRLIPEGMNLISSTGIVIENTLLTHGHTMPSENFGHVDRILMGHVHPVFFDENSVLNGQRVWVSIRTKKENLFPSMSGNLEIVIVPSFNRYFYATKKMHYKKSISPIIEKTKKDASARIVTLDGTIIGDESLLSHVL